MGVPGTSTLTTQLTGLTNHSLLLGGASTTLTNLGVATNGQIPIGSAAADPVLATITAGTGISVTNGAGSITIATTGSAGLGWTSTAATTIALAANTGYITTAGTAITATLPTASSIVGTAIGFLVSGAGTVTIAQGTGQQIRFGNQTTTSGATGTLTSTAQGDALVLICTTAASGSAGAWQCLNSVGNWTVV